MAGLAHSFHSQSDHLGRSYLGDWLAELPGSITLCNPGKLGRGGASLASVAGNSSDVANPMRIERNLPEVNLGCFGIRIGVGLHSFTIRSRVGLDGRLAVLRLFVVLPSMGEEVTQKRLRCHDYGPHVPKHAPGATRPLGLATFNRHYARDDNNERHGAWPALTKGEAMMNDSSNYETNLQDKPLCVLKYRWYWKASAIVISSFFTFFLGVCAFVLPAQNIVQWIYKPIFGFLSFVFGFQFVDVLLFNGIWLYPDRIVKRWSLLAQHGIKLANAQLRGRSLLGGTGKNFFSQNAKAYQRWLAAIFPMLGISYLEHFCDPQDVEEMNRNLAKLSGRKIEEFEGTRISMVKLMKEGKNNA